MSAGTAGLRVRLGVLTTVFTSELVDVVIAKHDRAERRRRLLPARLVVYFVLALCLFARESYEEVIQLLTGGISGTRALARVNRSSLSRARARLGTEVMETLFREVAGPLATHDTPGAWWRGLRLLALDGTQFDVPDSMSNGSAFDGPSTTDHTPLGFPQVRAVVLAEIGTHGVLDAAIGGYRDGERALAFSLAAAAGPGDLVIVDRGFWSVEFVDTFAATGTNLLARLQSNHLGTTMRELPDGSCLAVSRPGKGTRLRAKADGRELPEQITFRVITFTTDDGKTLLHLGTTLLDHERHPTMELIALYRQRWEIELAFDEVKNHLGPGGPLRSRTPDGVRQELWAFLAVHHAVRRVAHHAAVHTSEPVVDADRIPYLTCVRIIRRSVIAHLGATAAKLAEAVADTARQARRRLLPPRAGRQCPRAIKKPPRWPVLRIRASRGQADTGRWNWNPSNKHKPRRNAGKAFKATAPSP
ncbi:IS4 family transposase [Actinomadura roseirufa]|uniref:IS4 family transposase n=1 Tax=Actinomadura roseirufa TaxID=2094049 RepID=UPI001041AE61|nr:IS4 family transposase [Actinomadura roseirufa]